MRFARLICATLYATAAFAQAASAQTPMQKVLVFPAPILPIVEAVTQGVATPQSLSNSRTDAHTMLVTHSMAQALAEADVIVVADRGMSTALMRAIAKRAPKDVAVIALTELAGAEPAPYGSTNSYTEHVSLEDAPSVWKPSAFDKPKKVAHVHDGGSIDPHIWLDPIRMAAVAHSLAEALAELQPGYADTFRYNADQLALHLENEVDPAIRTMLVQASAHDKDGEIPYITYHDAFRYFSQRYDLSPTGYITQRPEEYVGAASMKALIEASKSTKVRCLITESESSLAKRIATRTEAKIIPLNVERVYSAKEGATAPWIRNDYDRLLAKVAETFAQCMSGEPDQ